MKLYLNYLVNCLSYVTGDEEDKLNTLMDDLGAFYMNSDNAREYAIIPAAVQVILQFETFFSSNDYFKVGLYCVQVIFGEYHRAKVLNVLPNDKVRVSLLHNLCIHYGLLFIYFFIISFFTSTLAL